MAKRIRTFFEIDSHEYSDAVYTRISEQMKKQSKDYILCVDEDEYVKYLVNECKLSPLKIDYDSERIMKPRISSKTVSDRFYDRTYEAEVYCIDVVYDFSGSAKLFEIQPSRIMMTSAVVAVDERNSTVGFTVELREKDPDKFNKQKSSLQSSAFTNINYANEFAEEFNARLEGQVRILFLSMKSEYLAENSFFEAIKVRVDKDTESMFTAPTVRKKVIVQPAIDGTKEFASSPTMAEAMYKDILKVTYDFGKSMEKKPSTYRGKDEEELRDQFLVILETRYEGVTATGETFNKRGKTDILLKYAPDNSNLFVAECKVWHGRSEMDKAISQLFDRYLTWRDSKAAIMMFVPNVKFTEAITAMKSAVSGHKYFVREADPSGETSFSYIMHIPGDTSKKVQLEVMAFHFTQKTGC